MVGPNIPTLAGLLSCSYYMHTVAVPVVRQTNRPDRKYQDLAWGYFAAMVTNLLAGFFGYCGFIGYSFREYYAENLILGEPARDKIDQNFINMFNLDSIVAVMLRLSVIFIMLTNYPVWSKFITDAVSKAFTRTRPLGNLEMFVLSVTIQIVPLLFTLFYPKVGTIMAYVGAISGFTDIFVLPVLLHLKVLRTKINESLEVNTTKE